MGKKLRLTVASVGEDIDQQEAIYAAGMNIIGTTTLENNLTLSARVRHLLTCPLDLAILS